VADCGGWAAPVLLPSPVCGSASIRWTVGQSSSAAHACCGGDLLNARPIPENAYPKWRSKLALAAARCTASVAGVLATCVNPWCAVTVADLPFAHKYCRGTDYNPMQNRPQRGHCLSFLYGTKFWVPHDHAVAI